MATRAFQSMLVCITHTYMYLFHFLDNKATCCLNAHVGWFGLCNDRELCRRSAADLPRICPRSRTLPGICRGFARGSKNAKSGSAAYVPMNTPHTKNFPEVFYCHA